MCPATAFRLLNEHTALDTTSPDEARQEFARYFCPHFFMPYPDGEFRAIHRASRQSGFSVNYVSYGSSVDIDPGELANFFLLQIPLAGTGTVRSGNENIEVNAGKSAAILSPTLPTFMHWSAGCEKSVVLFDRGLIERQCEALADRHIEKIEFSAEMNLDSAAGQLAMDHLRLIVRGIELEAAPDYLTRLGSSMADLLLTSFEHSASKYLRMPVTTVGSAVLSRAIEWVEANIETPFTAADVANAAGCSLRSLQESVRRQKGITLMDIVESLRLERFRKALLAPAQGQSVTDAALAAGLGHLGRAAIAYRRRYGETPIETLRRSRNM